MKIREQVYTRSNTTTPWYWETWSNQFIEYMKNEYYDNGKLSGSFDVDATGLKLTITQIFSDDQAFNQFENDTYLIQQRTLRDNYNSTNGIQIVKNTVPE